MMERILDTEDQLIGERDHWSDQADLLADLIAAYFGADFGEHSNMNCPVANAVEFLAIKVDEQKVVNKFIADQEPLGADFAGVIEEHAEQLYEA